MTITRRKFLNGLAALLAGTTSFRLPAYSQNMSQARRVSDGLDYLISKDYKEREEQWEREKEEYSNPKIKKKPSVNGIVKVEEGVSSLTGQESGYLDEARISPDFTFDDFKKAYSKRKWDNVLSKDEQKKAENIYEKLTLDERKILCELNLSPYNFYAEGFTPEQQKRFDAFNNALRYLYSINGKDGALKSHLQAFYSSNGATTEYYKKTYPWIALDKKNIPLNTADRVLVFLLADYLESKHGRKILNWKNIEALSKNQVSDDF